MDHDDCAQQLQDMRDAIFAIANALGAALPRTPEVVATFAKLEDHT